MTVENKMAVTLNILRLSILLNNYNFKLYSNKMGTKAGVC